jgi:hypothetical protein
MALGITFYRKFMVERLKSMENVKLVDKIWPVKILIRH